MRTSLLTVTMFLAAISAPTWADEAHPSRHVYRGSDSGTAERLAQPRATNEPVRVMKTQPLGERGTTSGTVAASNLGSQPIASGSTYEVQVRQPTEAVQQYVNVPPPANQDRTKVDNNARILAASASPEYRLAVDRNARVVRNYAIYQQQQQGEPQPQPQSDAQPQQQPEAQPQAGFVSVPPPQPAQETIYGNTYGTYSPQAYESRIKYTQPVSYAVERSNYYPVSYAPAYYAPTYSYGGYYGYRPSYSYCAPTYSSCYTPRYYGGYGYSSGYCGPRYGGYFGYSSGGYHGSRYGGYVGYSSGGYHGSSYGGYVGYSSGGHCGSRWSFGFRF